MQAVSRAASDGAGLFLSFFFRLRDRGLKVTPQQWMTVVEGLAKGLHGSSMIGFYSLARAVLVKDESELDDFDLCFAAHFEGAADFVPAIEREVMDWLSQPIPPYPIDPELRRLLDQVDVEALRAELERRLQEQKERHDGGDYWIGTGGTSAFGHGGYHPGGIRVGGQHRLGSAVQVAAERRYREHRRDLVLDTRQLGVALKKLRSLKREGQAEELDIDGTIDRTARQAGELELVFRPPRANNLSLLMAMDVGGSMEPYRHLVDVLFSAAHAARHFKRFEFVYFHNCVYDHVYEDAAFIKAVPLRDLIRRFDRDCRLVLVGDAFMYPGELLDRHGAIQWEDRNEEPGVVYLKKLAAHFRRTAWLNPMRERMWEAPSVCIVQQIFDMFPLTVDGVESLAKDLARG
ncbi:MAG: VWA domain-containing protein [Deltaproteobacteria bacterium]|nr:VWA domain-containing protein [Deltaproteobacteria bacterium]